MTMMAAAVVVWMTAQALCAVPAHGDDAATVLPPASFDCARATGIDERIICADPLLRSADTALSRHYVDLMKDPQYATRREALRTNEHSWIILRNKECGVAKATKIASEDLPGYVDCFLDAYDERADDLVQMKARPAVEPADIAAPIRKSLFAADEPASSIDPAALLSTGLRVAPAVHRRIAWLRDGSLLVLNGQASPVGLSLWTKQGAARTIVDHLEAAGGVDDLCDDGGHVGLVSTKDDGKHHGLDLLTADVPAAPLLAACPSAGRTVAGNDARIRLALGPPDRFVGIDHGDRSRIIVEPHIRIDHRFALRGAYEPFVDSFVVSPAARPDSMAEAVERRWAKTGCLTVWQVAASTNAATPVCIPYGSYRHAVPEPLPTRAGFFFGVGDHGLYRMIDGRVARVLDHAVDMPAVSPDGCLIAFARPAADQPGRQVMLLDACKLGTPS
jgi:uncharacterized protein